MGLKGTLTCTLQSDPLPEGSEHFQSQPKTQMQAVKQKSLGLKESMSCRPVPFNTLHQDSHRKHFFLVWHLREHHQYGYSQPVQGLRWPQALANTTTAEIQSPLHWQEKSVCSRDLKSWSINYFKFFLFFSDYISNLLCVKILKTQSLQK